MTRRKKTSSGIVPATDGAPSLIKSANLPPSPSISQHIEPSTSALIICRNKHWRYISSFHGPWLQLPPEVLESLAYSNYESPRPKPIDPAVFFDIVKIRRLVEDATDLAVRAATGTTSSGLGNSIHGGNGLMGGGSAAALGLGVGGSGAKLSRERKHRMRELATQKLARAYRFDEIAASVATMQGASSLEEVAKYVLQRKATDGDAKYVHFFHEKIPSRMLAQSTSLQALDEIIQNQPAEGAPLRTRAVTKIFKDDFHGAVNDLTEALSVYRCGINQHTAGRSIQVANISKDTQTHSGGLRNWQRGAKFEEVDQPNSLEAQLLFHRAGVYLTLACRSVGIALEEITTPEEEFQSVTQTEEASREAMSSRLEARKSVKANAKRALKDYISFLSHFEYTPGLPAEITEEFFQKVNAIANGLGESKGTLPAKRLLEMSGNSSLSNGNLSDPHTPLKRSDHREGRTHDFAHSEAHPSLPAPEVFAASMLFSSSPPPNLPAYPATSNTLVTRKAALQQRETDQLHLHSEQHEAVTYHPLLTDALHSLLLCHSLIQTSTKELVRHAHMVARLARICDGYPIFLASRSPSRADWMEVLQRASNWIGLQLPWEVLCAPAPLPGQVDVTKKEETEEQARERCKHQAIVEALADERVNDEASFQAAVEAHQRRAEDFRMNIDSGHSPKRWAQEDGKEYPISTERAAAIARWVMEAPRIATETKKKRRTKGGCCKSDPKNAHNGNLSISNLKIDSELSTTNV